MTDRLASPVDRKAILVLGMHGPDPDYFAHVAHKLGGDMPSDPGAITEFNDRILAAAGSSWDDWLPLNLGWHSSAVRSDFLVRAKDLLRAQFDTSPLFVLADPRMCRLASFWLEVLAALEIRPVAVLPQIDPADVGRLLAEQSGFQEGFSQLLWLRHILEAEVASRHVPRLFFEDRKFLTDWESVIGDVEKLANLSFPRRSVLVEGEVIAFLAAEAAKRGERNACGRGAVPPAWMQETRNIVERWCSVAEERGDFVHLDAIRAAFDAAAPSFLRVIASGIGADGYLSGIEINQALTQARDDLARRLEKAEAETERLKAEHQQSDEAEKEAARLKAELVSLGSELREREKESARKIVEAETEVARLRAELIDLGNALRTKEEEAARRLIEAENEAVRLKAELADLGSALRQKQEEAVQAWADVAVAQQLKDQADAEVRRTIDQNQRLFDGFARIEARMGTETEEFARLRDRAAESERALSALRGEYGEAVATLGAKSAEIDALRTRVARADGELAHLTVLHAEAEEKHLQRESALQDDDDETARGDGRREETRRQTEWLRQMAIALRGRPVWWFLMGAKARSRLERELLEARGLFDSAAYLARNPDVAQDGMDPLVHYINHGLLEGRSW